MTLKVISCDFFFLKKQKRKKEKKNLYLLLSLFLMHAYEQSLSKDCAAFSTGHGTRKSIEGEGVQDDPECLPPSSSPPG